MARVEITSIGPQKVKVIKAIRTVSGAGLKEASDLADRVERVGSCSIELIPGMTVESATNLLQAEGATVSVIGALSNSNNSKEQAIPYSNADEIRKYKGLLDDGIITQEEFDAKKKQLLGLSDSSMDSPVNTSEKIENTDTIPEDTKEDNTDKKVSEYAGDQLNYAPGETENVFVPKQIFNPQYSDSDFRNQVELQKERLRKSEETPVVEERYSEEQNNHQITKKQKENVDYSGTDDKELFIVFLIISFIPFMNILAIVYALFLLKDKKHKKALTIIVISIIILLITLSSCGDKKKKDTTAAQKVETRVVNQNDSEEIEKEHEHDVQGATCTEPGKCSICGEIVGEPLGHDKEEISRTDATCQEEGGIEYRCKRCGETWNETLPIADHTWDEGEVLEEATYFEEGLTRYTCTVCGEVREQHQPKIEITDYDSLSEEDYKKACKIEYYETFVKNRNDEGKYVKFHAYISDKRDYVSKAFFTDFEYQLYKAYDLELKFTVACVQSRDYHDNYGPDLRVMYLKGSGLDNSKVKVGEYYTIYGYCAYNDNIQATVVIPKYIEKSKYGEEWPK